MTSTSISMAEVQGDLVPGVSAIAAPLFDQKNRIVGVIGSSDDPKNSMSRMAEQSPWP